MINKDELLDRLGNVHEFLQAIDDPGADAVAIAAAILSGAATFQGGARLLSLEEVREWKGFLWVEIRENGAMSKGIFVKMEEADMIFHLRRPYWIGQYSAVLYGLRFRCWASEPTAEDMAAAEWEAEENG